MLKEALRAPAVLSILQLSADTLKPRFNRKRGEREREREREREEGRKERR